MDMYQRYAEEMMSVSMKVLPTYAAQNCSSVRHIYRMRHHAWKDLSFSILRGLLVFLSIQDGRTLLLMRESNGRRLYLSFVENDPESALYLKLWDRMNARTPGNVEIGEKIVVNFCLSLLRESHSR